MSWYNTVELTDPHILWSRVRYLRALATLPFDRATLSESSAAYREYEKADAKLEKIMSDNGFHKEIVPPGYCAEACALAEKQFVSFRFALAGEWRAVYFNDPCSLTIFTGGESYITLQALTGGGSLPEAYKIASEAEELLDSKLEFAYSDKFGYLSSDISKCGSGVEFSSALYLPSLRHGTRLQEIKRKAESFGAVFSPFMSRYDNAGDIYVIEYRPAFRSDENHAVAIFSELIAAIIDDERRNERIIFSNKSTIIIDRAYRALGTLAYAKMIDEEEMLSLLSRIRLALSLEETKKNAPQISIALINSLVAEGLNNSVLSRDGCICESLDDCRAERASFLNRRLTMLGSESEIN